MDLLKDLDTMQQEAVRETEGAVLILAGAGSGKTRVLTYKVAFLIERGEDPNSIIAVTFTNKAANEMKERIRKSIVGSSQFMGGQMPFVGTFHAFCAKLLRIDGKFIGVPRGYLIYDGDDSLSLIKKIMKDLNISIKAFKPSSILGAIFSAKGELLSPVEYAQFARGAFAQTVSEIYELYEKALLEIGACDFDDLLVKTVRLFRENPQVMARYSGQFKYVLVDEYQDVNTVQYTLTKMLASTWGNITVVGDASQAIYSFRGADFRNILNFERDFKDVKAFNLEQNYRSTGNILSAANSVISKNKAHPVLNLWTKNSVGEKLTIYNAQNEIDEANFIVERVLNSAEPFSTFSVLYRTNTQSRTIEEAFLRANIPYRLYGGVRFYERKEIKDVLAYLRLIVNPKDKVSRGRLEKIGKGRLKKFEEMADGIKNSSLVPPISLISKVLDATKYLELIDDGTDRGLMRVENVKELKSVASDFENLETFLESVALMEGKVAPDKSYEKNDDPNFVTLMTIHTAKGLEFDNVFIIGMEEGLFPHSKSMLDLDEIEEERRLAYVAMTRARKKLYLSYATQRLYFGTTSHNLVSRFIVDIPEKLISAI